MLFQMHIFKYYSEKKKKASIKNTTSLDHRVEVISLLKDASVL